MLPVLYQEACVLCVCRGLYGLEPTIHKLTLSRVLVLRLALSESVIASLKLMNYVRDVLTRYVALL